LYLKQASKKILNLKKNDPKTIHWKNCSASSRQISDNLPSVWWELTPHYFLADCFGGSSYLVGTGSTLFSGGLFWRQLRFGGNWHHIILRRIVLEAAQIWWELAPHYFLLDCFGGISDLAGTGTTLFSGGLFWRQLIFGRNWLHVIFRRIDFGGVDIGLVESHFNIHVFNTCKTVW
jgi:hypothetical protein